MKCFHSGFQWVWMGCGLIVIITGCNMILRVTSLWKLQRLNIQTSLINKTTTGTYNSLKRLQRKEQWSWDSSSNEMTAKTATSWITSVTWIVTHDKEVPPWCFIVKLQISPSIELESHDLRSSRYATLESTKIHRNVPLHISLSSIREISQGRIDNERVNVEVYNEQRN